MKKKYIYLYPSDPSGIFSRLGGPPLPQGQGNGLRLRPYSSYDANCF